MGSNWWMCKNIYIYKTFLSVSAPYGGTVSNNSEWTKSDLQTIIVEKNLEVKFQRQKTSVNFQLFLLHLVTILVFSNLSVDF